MDNVMLLDILAVVIGFATVMLLLSLMVTALVQTAQHLFRLRGKNLVKGLAQLFEVAAQDGVFAAATGPAPAESRGQGIDVLPGGLSEMAVAPARPATAVEDPHAKGRRLSAEVVRRANVLTPAGEKVCLLGRLLGRLVDGGRTWIGPEEFREAVAASEPGLQDPTVDELTRRFQRAEKTLSNRFKGEMRLVTLAASFLVAAYFQVAATRLLRDLVESRRLRDAAVSLAPQVLQGPAANAQSLVPHSDVSEEALRELARRHEALRAKLEGAAGSGKHEDVVEELARVLADIPTEQREALVKEYTDLVDALRIREAQKSRGGFSEPSGYLAMLEIRPWREGSSFYVGRAWFENWVGLVLTTIALSLGAPFWFTVLQNVVNLRDSFKPREGPKEVGSQTPVEGG